MQRPQSETVTLDDILITKELSRRSPRSPNLQAENQALHTLARQLVNQPETILQTLVDIALDLCSAGTAGVSLLEVLPSGEEIFRWNVLAGTLEQYVGGSTPRDFSPCGVCLERGVPVLFSHPERYFTYFQEAKTPVVEGLVLPLIADNHALGSIWIMSHCEQRHFDSEDVRVMTSLADFTAAALLLNQRQTQELLAKNAQLEAVVVERKRAEESARESEAYFRAIANLVPDMLWRNDSTGYATWYSQRWLDYTGQTLEEVQGYGWLEVIHPGDRAQSLANFQNAVDERRPLRQEHRIRGTDGNYRWFQVQADPVFDSDGRIIQWFGAAIDIHDQRMALVALQESEKRLQERTAMLERAQRVAEMGHWTYDVATQELFWSREARRIFVGECEFELSYEAAANLVHPEDLFNLLAATDAAIAQKIPLEVEYRIIRPDGSERTVYLSADLDFDEALQPIKMFGIVQDVTDTKHREDERKRAEAALRESEKRLQVMIENLPGGAVFVVDRDLRYLLADGEALYAADFKPEDLVGKTIFEALPPELAAEYEGIYRKTLAGESFVREHNAHGSSYISRGTPLRTSSGEVYAVLTVSYDISDRKQAEAALRESEAKFRAIVNLLPALLWQIDPIGQEIAWNPRWVEFTGQTIKQSHHDGWLEAIHPEDCPNTARVFEEAYRTQRELEVQHRVRRHDGEYRWFLVRQLPIKDEKGAVVQWFGAAIDIHDQQVALEALRQSEAKYQSLFQSIDQGYAVVEVLADGNGEWNDFLFLEVNSAFLAQTGMVNSVGRKATEILGTPNPAWAKIYGRVAETGEPMRFEQNEETLDRIFDLYAFRLGGAESRRVAVLFTDITDRKRTEERLRRAAELDAFQVALSDALRSLTDPVEIQAVAARLLGEHLGANQVHYGETIGEYVVINHGYGNGLPPMVGRFRSIDFGERLVADYQAGRTTLSCDLLNDPNINEAERQVITGAGFQAYIAVPLTKEEGWVATLAVHSVVPRNWTTHEVELVQETAERTWATVERARAEAALRESEIQRIQEQAAREEERQRAESLAELDRAKTLFFTNVSHEFRTPLTLLLAPLQDALSDRVNPLPPPHRERLELAHRNAMRLLKLVNTLLDFSRIEAGRNLGVYEATDLALLTTELASVFRSAIERAGLRLIVDCPPLPEPVYVDRQMWEKIVLNLLSNAFKFTFVGEIAVRLHPADDHHVRLQVQDTGTGIPPEELPHLFERFYQVRGAQARTHEGSGIGLALVHELIRLHGGTVDVSSTVGEGTCFTVTIPLGTAHLPNDRIEATRTLVSTALGAAPYVEEAERWLPEEAGEQESRGAGENQEFLSSAPPPLCPSARVLLVDDNADMRDYLTRILSEHVQVQAVADGAAALAAAQERVPDLILSDVMMPGLDGFELLKALRAEPCTREVPIILLSARAGEESVVEGLQAGADDYLIKPFSATELVIRVLAHLQMAHLRLEALRQERITTRRKDEMLSTVSHELNTPLVAILGWTRLLRTSPVNQSMLMKSLETIERNATLQAKLISDLLDISRITAGKLRLNLEPVELQSVIEMAIATVHQTLQTKNIELTCLLEPLPIIIQGDPDRLQQIVLNLLTNAIKFTPKGGRIEVCLDVIETQAQIKVSDTGCGIAAEFLPYVFDHFRQAENSSSTKGLGLGLAIARHLVELHSGTIQAESLGVGQGATFTVKLPLIDASF